jgi:hypothetical protein
LSKHFWNVLVISLLVNGSINSRFHNLRGNQFLWDCSNYRKILSWSFGFCFHSQPNILISNCAEKSHVSNKWSDYP